MQTNSLRLRPMHCRKIHFCTAKIALKIEGGIDTVGAHHGLDILAAHRLFHGVLLSRCPAAILLSVTLALLTAKVNGRFIQNSAHILPFLCHARRRQGNTAPRPAARAPKRRDSPSDVYSRIVYTLYEVQTAKSPKVQIKWSKRPSVFVHYAEKQLLLQIGLIFLKEVV